MNNERLLTASGIVRQCSVIPFIKEGERKTYVLTTIREVNGEESTYACAPKYLEQLLTDYGIPVPTPVSRSVPVTGLIGKAVEIGYNVTVEGVTKYLDKDGKEQTSKSNGNNLRKIYVLPEHGIESSAFAYASLQSRGVSESALNAVARQHAAVMEQSLRYLQSTQHIPPQQPPAQQYSKQTEPIPEEELEPAGDETPKRGKK